MPYLIHDPDDWDPMHPQHVTDTAEEAYAWIRRMEAQYGGPLGLAVYGPNEEPPLAMTLSCHCDEGPGWGPNPDR